MVYAVIPLFHKIQHARSFDLYLNLYEIFLLSS